MKVAKLELKVVLAMILLGYEYELVDGNGNSQKTIPEQDRNDLLEVSSPGPCIFKLLNLLICFYIVAAPRGSMLYEIQTNRRVKKKNISHQVTCSGSVSIRDIFCQSFVCGVICCNDMPRPPNILTRRLVLDGAHLARRLPRLTCVCRAYKCAAPK